MGQFASDGHIQEFYHIKEKLGVGSFGLVKRGVNKKTDEEVAIKIIKKRKITKNTKNLIEREVGITMKLKHPGIVSLVDCYESDKNVYLVLELCRGGEVFDRVATEGKFSEKLASKVIRQIVEAVSYLHKQGIIHRDLKPENLLYVNKKANSKVKITDFGFARRIDSPTDTMETTCGTLNYVAPEVLAGKPYGKECDLWSIGVITYVLLAGYLPFYGEDKHTTFKLIVSGNYDFADDMWDDISDAAKNLIKGLLTLDTTKRLTLEQVLANDWIKNPDKAIKSDKDFPDFFSKKLAKTNRTERREKIDITKQNSSDQPDLYGVVEEDETKEPDAPAKKAEAAKADKKDAEADKEADKDAKKAPPNPNSNAKAEEDPLKTIAKADV